MGQPQRSRRDVQGGPSEPLRFGVPALDQQRQVDGPALEPDAGHLATTRGEFQATDYLEWRDDLAEVAVVAVVLVADDDDILVLP